MSPEVKKEVLSAILKANGLLKEEWDKDPKNNKEAAGCYYLLNSLAAVVRGEDDRDYGLYYIFSRIFVGIKNLAAHYKLTVQEALQVGAFTGIL